MLVARVKHVGVISAYKIVSADSPVHVFLTDYFTSVFGRGV